MSLKPATIVQTTPQVLLLSGCWTARGIWSMEKQIGSVQLTAPGTLDGTGIEALDSVGAWVLQGLLARLRTEGTSVQLDGLCPEFGKRLGILDQYLAGRAAQPAPAPMPSTQLLERIGLSAGAAYEQVLALLSFVGECAVALAGSVAHPQRFRWRPILYNIRAAGFDALPIVGLLAFLLGVVVAYQGADQLRRYGANIFVADLVGLSMLREFAPLITAIIIAGRSGSAYAAQIGTMSVTEEIDALRTLGIAPLELLVLPKLIALLIALPLLTLFADLLGVAGGMLMARSQLGVGFGEFLDRFVKAVSVTSYLIGICKAPVFAGIIALVGSFQGFLTQGGADSVGLHTTRAVVQSVVLVIIADALFSVAFSALGL